MSFLNFLKKKGDIPVKKNMALPPIPSMPVFPEPNNIPTPQLDDSGLPPLPHEIPGTNIAPKNIEDTAIATPQLMNEIHDMNNDFPQDIGAIPEMPQPIPNQSLDLPTIPEPPQITEPNPNLVTTPNVQTPFFPEKPVETEFIPDKIPPLETLPPPPRKKEVQVEEPLKEISEKTIIPIKRKHIKQTFVKVESFKSIIDSIEEVKIKFKHEEEVFSTIIDIKNSQDQKFEKFREYLEDLQRKLIFIDKTIFESL